MVLGVPVVVLVAALEITAAAAQPTQEQVVAVVDLELRQEAMPQRISRGTALMGQAVAEAVEVQAMERAALEDFMAAAVVEVDSSL